MPQVYVREDQFDAIIALGLEDKEERRQFIRDCLEVGIKKEARKRKITLPK